MRFLLMALLVLASPVLAQETSIQFTWDAQAGVDSYNVYYSQAQGEYDEGQQLDTSVATCEGGTCAMVCTVPSGPLYWFVATAENVAGAGPPSDEISVDTASPPGKVTNFTGAIVEPVIIREGR